MKCRNISQILLLMAGITMISYGAVRGEAAVVLGKSNKTMSGVCRNWIRKKNLLSKQTVRLRGWIQAAATLLTNIHIPNLFKGKIYQGNVKTVCVPGLNCYSCPAATEPAQLEPFRPLSDHPDLNFHTT